MATAAYLNEMLLALIAWSAIDVLVTGFAVSGFGRWRGNGKLFVVGSGAGMVALLVVLTVMCGEQKAHDKERDGFMRACRQDHQEYECWEMLRPAKAG